MKKRIVVVALLLVAAVGQAEELTPKPQYERIAKTASKMMPRHHINHAPLSDGISRRFLDNFLRALDYDRTLFKADDVRKLRSRANDLDDFLVEGNVNFAYEAFAVYKDRVADRVAFSLGLLEEGFDLDQDETYTWKRKDAAWAVDDAEWDDLWRRKIKNEYIGLLVSKEIRALDAEEKAAEEAEAQEAENAEGDGDSEADADKPQTNPVDAEDAAESSDADAGVEVVAKDESLEEALSAEESIKKRYTQLLTIVNGHDSEYVLQNFLSAFTRAYDSHSSYFAPRAQEDFDIQMSLSLTGIGALLSYDEGTAKIEKLIKGGPAEKDGRLKPGDKIVAVAQAEEEPVDILFWPLYKSVRLIRGEVGSTVVLSVIPATDPTGTVVKKVDLVRDHIKLEDKAAKSKVIDFERGAETNKLGVIYLPDFYANLSGRKGDADEVRRCSVDVERLLEKLNAENVDGLVLDLRNNGGGSLQDCVTMSGFFIDQGPIVQVKSGRRVQSLYDTERGILFDKPMVVLVNRQSASASEILAAALQDYGRAVIIGDSKTHGKGSVQSLIDLERNDPTLGSLKVTTAAFYRIDGRSTQLKGVSPDIVIRTATDVMELGEEYLDNVLPWSWVNPAAYRPYSSLSSRIRELKTLSQNRLDDSEKFQGMQDKIDRLAERVGRRSVSLHLQERIEQAKADRELDKLHEDGFALEDSDEESDEDVIEEIQPDRDLVLKESLEILTDLITGVKPAPEAAAVGIGQ